MKPHDADGDPQAAVARASHFVVTLYHGGHYQTHELRTLGYARECGRLLVINTGSMRRPIVYAIVDGVAMLIPDSYVEKSDAEAERPRRKDRRRATIICDGASESERRDREEQRRTSPRHDGEYPAVESRRSRRVRRSGSGVQRK